MKKLALKVFHIVYLLVFNILKLLYIVYLLNFEGMLLEAKANKQVLKVLSKTKDIKQSWKYYTKLMILNEKQN